MFLGSFLLVFLLRYLLIERVYVIYFLDVLLENINIFWFSDR